jgi:hypothetical protein
MTLAACGGGGSDSPPPVAPLQRASGPFEFNQCSPLPTAVRIAREVDNGNWRTNRYIAYAAGDPLAKMVAPAPLETGKNPEGVIEHGPLVAVNCTPGAVGQFQTMRLRLKTEDFFASEVGDHLAFGLRSYFPTANREGQEALEAIGIILHRRWGGVLAERFRRPGGNDIGSAEGAQVPMQDGVQYLIELQATTTAVSFRVTVEATGQTTGWKTYMQPADFAPVQGTGFLIAVLCQDDNARCEAYNRPFRIEFTDIVLGWS